MRDWIMITAPVALIGYFMAYPHQFQLFIYWARRLIP